MKAFLSATWPAIRALGQFERGVCVALMGFIVLSMMVQVVTRYLLGQPIVWVEEAAGYCFIWMSFLGAAVGFKELRHIRIDTFIARMRARPQHALRGVIYLICTIAALTVGWYALDIMEVESRSNTIALPIELPRHLFYSLPLAVAMLSIAITGMHLVASYWLASATGAPIPAELDVDERRRIDETLLNH